MADELLREALQAELTWRVRLYPRRQCCQFLRLGKITKGKLSWTRATQVHRSRPLPRVRAGSPSHYLVGGVTSLSSRKKDSE